MTPSQVKTATDTVNARLQHVIGLHFDPDGGSSYWIEKAKQLGLDAARQILSIENLALLGPMDESALSKRPIEDFIPRSLVHKKTEFIFAETAGTLGKPKFAVHMAEEFQAAFVDPFVAAAKRVAFPRQVNWLFVGPTGPHIIGKAARSCAKALGSPDVFSVDFDPRWAKKLITGSFAGKRYLEHVEAQAMRVLEVQNIGVIFSTPAVLESMANKISIERRAMIRGIHLGGMSASVQFMDKLADMFPGAVVLSGYGNTLFGMMPQLDYDQTKGFDYYPQGNRLIVRIVQYDESDDVQFQNDCVEYGMRGQVTVHRLDEIQFIANMVERDTAVRIEPRADALSDGFVLDGIRDPEPIITENTKPVIGLY